MLCVADVAVNRPLSFARPLTLVGPERKSRRSDPAHSPEVPIRIARAFEVSVKMLLRMQACDDASEMRARGGAERCPAQRTSLGTKRMGLATCYVAKGRQLSVGESSEHCW